MYKIFENIETNIIDFSVGKILVCKNDPTLKIKTLKMLAKCQKIKEIEHNWDDYSNTKEFKQNRYINLAYSAIGKNDSEDLRIFKIDNSATSQQLVTTNYFVNALEFDKNSFEHFKHCKYLLIESKNFKEIFNDNFDCSYPQLAKNKKSEIEYYLDDFENKLCNYYIQKLNSIHLNNKW